MKTAHSFILLAMYLLLFSCLTEAFLWPSSTLTTAADRSLTRPKRPAPKISSCSEKSTADKACPRRISYSVLSTRNNNNHQGRSLDVAFYGLSAFSLVTSACTLWSEASIFRTGCGPIYMSDLVERVSYQAVLVVSGLAWFIRIVFRQGLGGFAADQGMLHDHARHHRWSRKLLGLTETAAYLAALLAVVVLVNQRQNNVEMDGLSGIDIAACEARRDFLLESND